MFLHFFNLYSGEDLNRFARADGARFFVKARFGRRRNTLCISSFSNRSIGGKDSSSAAKDHSEVSSFPKLVQMLLVEAEAVLGARLSDVIEAPEARADIAEASALARVDGVKVAQTTKHAVDDRRRFRAGDVGVRREGPVAGADDPAVLRSGRDRAVRPVGLRDITEADAAACRLGKARCDRGELCARDGALRLKAVLTDALDDAEPGKGLYRLRIPRVLL